MRRPTSKERSVVTDKTRDRWTALRPLRRDAENAPAAAQDQWTGKQAHLTKAIQWLMLAGVAGGLASPVLLITGAGTPDPPMATAKTSSAPDPGEQARAGELATQFVVTWLQAARGDEKSLRSFVNTDRLRLPTAQTFVASDASVANIEPTHPTDPSMTDLAGTRPSGSGKHPTGSGTPAPPIPHAWTVTVAATVRGVDEQPSAAARRFYQVPVVFTRGGAGRAATLPAPVAAPAVGDDIDLGYRHQLSSDHPIWMTVGEFLTALTVGGGDVSRYTSPGTQIRAIVPPPYKAVTLLDVRADRDFTLSDARTSPADGSSTRVLVTAEMTADSATHTLTGQWALTLTARGGRWEISAMDAAPLLATPSPPPAATPSPAPAGSPTATTTTSRPSSSPAPTTAAPGAPAR